MCSDGIFVFICYWKKFVSSDGICTCISEGGIFCILSRFVKFAIIEEVCSARGFLHLVLVEEVCVW